MELQEEKDQEVEMKGLQSQWAASPWFRRILRTTEYCCGISKITLN